MGVGLAMVGWLRRQGHDAKHLRFGEIAALSGGRKASVVLFRLHDTRTPHVIDRLSAALADCMPALERGAVVIVEESRYRVRPLPIGSSGPD